MICHQYAGIGGADLPNSDFMYDPGLLSRVLFMLVI